jgi:hypothetical protein
MPKRISTARGREFGDGLRVAIGATGLSSRAIAEIVGWHESKLSDLVRGKGGASELEVGILLGACRTELPERQHLLGLYREADIRGWWQQHGVRSPARLRTVVEHLTVASSLVSWQTHVVPCFLQTDRYAREVMRASANVPAEEVEERAAAQVEMQELLRCIPSCTFISTSWPSVFKSVAVSSTPSNCSTLASWRIARTSSSGSSLSKQVLTQERTGRS